MKTKILSILFLFLSNPSFANGLDEAVDNIFNKKTETKIELCDNSGFISDNGIWECFVIDKYLFLKGYEYTNTYINLNNEDNYLIYRKNNITNNSEFLVKGPWEQDLLTILLSKEEKLSNYDKAISLFNTTN